ncbi:MAG TPA: nuclear transport factor 2 family protein [Vicinamibacteria bacterium]|jgi:ketosteroid isomerase-like protein|nr:nuclear transport factor 2 family protein [Vicinamibacteria bacterium]
MTRIEVSRRNLLEAGACALAGAVVSPVAAGARELSGLGTRKEEVIRRWYAAWEKKDWGPVDALLADNFTFTSAAGDDHISKSVFKTRCWETQIDFIKRFDLERVVGNGNEAFVKYLCHTKNSKSFRNVEYLRVTDDKVEAIECYFGEQSSFPSAVDGKK